MKTFFALIHARNKEFLRDRGALSWSLIFPLLIIIGCAFAFSDEQENLFKVGVIGSVIDSVINNSDIALLQSPYTRVIEYQDIEQAKNRIAHHQLHLLITQTPEPRYWINEASSQGQVLKLLMAQQAPGFQQALIEGKKVRYVDWVIPGILSMNIMFGSLFGVGYVLVRYRKMGVLKRLQATPISAFEFLAAQVCSRLFIIVGASAVIFAGSNLFLHFLVLGSYWDLLVVGMVGALAMISLGLLIAARTASEELAGGILNASTWPMMFLSGVWFSLDDSPRYMQLLAECLPLTHLVAAAREIMINGATLGDVSQHLLTMLAMALVFLGLASSGFRWHK
jgi:ABC-type multidrug transport system permease subunit